MRFRNTYDAFNGDIQVGQDDEDGMLTITWTKEDLRTTLRANFKTLTYSITYFDRESGQEQTL